MNKFELRFNEAEFKVDETGELKVSGYVNKTGMLSNVLGASQKFQEKIAKGAFARAISNRKKDIDFLAEHDNKKILSSTRNNSLILQEDEIGLWMEATITPTTWGKDYYELIKSGILQNMSFGFRALRDSWKRVEVNLYERTVEELELFEVSVVKDPAYSQSTISARGIDVVENVAIPEELEEENRNMESMKQAIEALTQKVDTLTSMFEELRNVGEEQTQTPETVEEVQETEEVTAEEEIVSTTTEIDEEEDNTVEQEDEKVSDENTENSESSEEVAVEEEIVEEEQQTSTEEEQRGMTPEDIAAEHASLRSRLDALK